jgi:hypothetical protein
MAAIPNTPIPTPQAVVTPMSGHVTIYEFRRFLSEWYLPDLENLYDLLCMAQAAHVNTDVLTELVSAEIGQVLNKIGVSS